MKGRTLASRGWLLLGLLLAGSVESGAREVYRQRPARGSPQAGVQKGGREATTLSLEGASRGMISFDLHRDAASGSDNSGAVPVKFLDADGKGVLILRVECVFDQDPTRAAVILRVPDLSQSRHGLWDPLILLDERIEPGRTAHFDLTWDDETGECGLFVDGRAVNPRPGTYDPTTKTFGRSVRQAANEQAARLGAPLPYAGTPFGTILAKVRTVVVGEATSSSGTCRNRSKRALVGDVLTDRLVVAVDESPTDLHAAKRDVRNLVGVSEATGVLLTWSPPEVHGIDQKYFVYRRTGADGAARFERLTKEPLRDLRYVDATAQTGQSYRYSVTSVYGDLKGGVLEGTYPPEATVTAVDGLAVASVAAEKALYRAGQVISVTLRGTADKTATFTLEGLVRDASMAEVDDGVYVGKVPAPGALSKAGIALTGRLVDTATGAAATKAGPPVALDTEAPHPAPGIVVSVPWVGEIEVSWQASRSVDVDHYEVLRAVGADPSLGAAAYQTTRELSLVDRAVIPGLDYHYAVVAVDKADNTSALSSVVTAQAAAGDGPRIGGVALEPFGKPLRPGEIVTVTLTGASGGRASADLGPFVTDLALVEQGRSGVYVGTYTVRAEDVGATLGTAQTVGHLADDFGASVQAGPVLMVVGQDTLDDNVPPLLTAVTHDGFAVAGFSGALTAGDVVTVTAQGESGGSAWFDIGGIVTGRLLAETSTGSGVYTGTYAVRFGDEGEAATVTGHLADAAGNETTLAATRTLAFDTRVRLTVEADDKLLPADRKAKTRLTARAANVNGKAISGHEIALTLSTTEDYTGVVGGGTLAGLQATMDDVDDVEVKWGGTTDNFGEVKADYTAGFAAKTALVLAKDLTTGDVGAGWLNTYVASTVAIELEPRTQKGAEDLAALRVAADPAKLTADGRSTSRIKVWLTDPAGAPLAGAKVAFALANANGRLKVLRGTTDVKGVAEAEYRAGTVIGTVTVTASAADYGVTGNVQITLMSDAPAKIDLVASAGKLVANGSDTANLSVAVTDIHDNPNQEVPVTFALLKGAGKLSAPALLTDRNGEGAVTFTAGTQPGVVTIEARHTSRAPTEEELRRIYGTLFVPRWFERQERDRLTVAEWLVKPGEKVAKGQTLAVLSTRRNEWTVAAPAKGVFIREVKHEGDQANLGETLGYLEIDPDVWRDYGMR